MAAELALDWTTGTKAGFSPLRGGKPMLHLFQNGLKPQKVLRIQPSLAASEQVFFIA